MTHWHHDHIGGVPDVLKSLNKTVPVHKFPRSLQNNSTSFIMFFVLDSSMYINFVSF